MKRSSLSLLSAAIFMTCISAAGSVSSQPKKPTRAPTSDTEFAFTVYCTPDFSEYVGKTYLEVKPDLEKKYGIEVEYAGDRYQTRDRKAVTIATFIVPPARGTPEIGANSSHVPNAAVASVKSRGLGILKSRLGSIAGSALTRIVPGASGIAGELVNAASISTQTAAQEALDRGIETAMSSRPAAKQGEGCRTPGSSAMDEQTWVTRMHMKYLLGGAFPLYQTDYGRLLFSSENRGSTYQQLAGKEWVWSCGAEFTNRDGRIREVLCAPVEKLFVSTGS